MFEDLIEEYEPDEEAGLPAPRYASEFAGHQEQERFVLNLINKGQVPHAMILAGPRGIGKATFGYALARALLKHGASDPGQDSLFGDSAPATLDHLNIAEDDPVHRKVASGGHPDFLALERPMDERKGQPKETFDIETARKAAPFLRMTASDGGWRVVLIDDADTMTINAQNAVLKILEEPPKNSILILICHRPGALIPTIRSRCRFLSFDPLAEETVIELLQKHAPGESEHTLDTLTAIAEGSAGQAIRLLDENAIGTFESLIAILETWENWDWPQIHRLCDALGRAGQERSYKAFTDIFLWTLNSMCLAKAYDQIALDPPLDHKALRDMLAHYSLEDWSEICNKLETHFKTFARSHLDKRQAILGAFSLIQ